MQRTTSRIRTFLNPSTVIAMLALVVALGGTAYAGGLITGARIKNNSVTGRDIRNNSLTGNDVRNRSLTPQDFRGSVQGAQGPQGPQGAQGAQGPAGSARAYALVSSNGGFGRSLNVASVTHLSTGKYCVTLGGGLSTANTVALATPDFSSPPVYGDDNIDISQSNTSNDCTSGQFEVRYLDSADVFKDGGFAFMVP